jgi:cell division protein FtsL
VVLALVAGTMCFALAVAARQAAVAKVGYEIVGLRRALSDLEAQNQRLEGQVARLQSLERVESEAKKLGMKKPDSTRLVYSVEPQKLPGSDALAADNQPKHWLQQAASTLAKLASGIMRVQAQPIK